MLECVIIVCLNNRTASVFVSDLFAVGAVSLQTEVGQELLLVTADVLTIKVSGIPASITIEARCFLLTAYG